MKIAEYKINKIVKESINKVLNEDLKWTDEENIVPQEVAEKYEFEREYICKKNGLEIWGRYTKNPMLLLRRLGINRFSSENERGHVAITVKPTDTLKNRLDNKETRWRRKFGDYVSDGYGDKYGEFFRNPKNGHFKKIRF